MLCMIGSLDFLVLKGPTCSNLYPVIHPYQSEVLVQELEQVLISLLPFFFLHLFSFSQHIISSQGSSRSALNLQLSDHSEPGHF